MKYCRIYFLFYLKIATPPSEKSPPLSQQPSLKTEVLSSLPFSSFENLVGGSTPTLLPCRKGGWTLWVIICLWYGTLWFFDRKDSVRPIWCGGFFQKYFCILILISNFEFRIFVIIIATILHHDTWLSIGRLHSDCYMICVVALINYFI